MSDIIKIDDLTLNVMVRDRHYNIPNILKFYKNLDCKKIIFDSSIKRYDDEISIKKYGFEYIYFGPMAFWEKVFRTVSSVKTKYMIDNPDDDVTLISSIEKCVNFLNENDDYCCCYGIEIDFDDNGFIHPDPDTPSTMSGIVSTMAGVILDYRNESPFERIYSSLTKDPAGYSHGTFKTEVLKNFFTMIYNNPSTQFLNFPEKAIMAFSMIYGNKKVLPLIYRLRNRSNRQDRVFLKHLDELNENKHLINSLDKETLGPLADTLSLNTGVNKDQCFDSIKKSLEEHFHFQKTLQNSLTGAWCRVNLDSPPDIYQDIKELEYFSKLYLNDYNSGHKGIKIFGKLCLNN